MIISLRAVMLFIVYKKKQLKSKQIYNKKFVLGYYRSAIAKKGRIAVLFCYGEVAGRACRLFEVSDEMSFFTT